jgi:hypothetical protein
MILVTAGGRAGGRTGPSVVNVLGQVGRELRGLDIVGDVKQWVGEVSKGRRAQHAAFWSAGSRSRSIGTPMHYAGPT